MNQALLKQKADRLRAELLRASSNPHAVDLQNALSELLDQVDAGAIKSDLEWEDVPGGRLFSDGPLHDNHALGDAYADFKLLITGMD